jgi:hypothetical protein
MIRKVKVQLHWQYRNENDRHEFKAQATLTDGNPGEMEEFVRVTRQRYPIPEDKRRDIVWCCVLESSKHFVPGKD